MWAQTKKTTYEEAGLAWRAELLAGRDTEGLEDVAGGAIGSAQLAHVRLECQVLPGSTVTGRLRIPRMVRDGAGHPIVSRKRRWQGPRRAGALSEPPHDRHLHPVQCRRQHAGDQNDPLRCSPHYPSRLVEEPHTSAHAEVGG